MTVVFHQIQLEEADRFFFLKTARLDPCRCVCTSPQATSLCAGSLTNVPSSASSTNWGTCIFVLTAFHSDIALMASHTLQVLRFIAQMAWLAPRSGTSLRALEFACSTAVCTRFAVKKLVPSSSRREASVTSSTSALHCVGFSPIARGWWHSRCRHGLVLDSLSTIHTSGSMARDIW